MTDTDLTEAGARIAVFGSALGALGDMAWVRFTGDFDYSPTEMSDRTTVAYKAGMELSVRTECRDKAVAAGKAVEVPTPGRAEPLTEPEAPPVQEPIAEPTEVEQPAAPAADVAPPPAE